MTESIHTPTSKRKRKDLIKIDWQKTKDANAGVKISAINMKRGSYTTVLVNEAGDVLYSCPAYCVPEIIRAFRDEVPTVT